MSVSNTVVAATGDRLLATTAITQLQQDKTLSMSSDEDDDERKRCSCSSRRRLLALCQCLRNVHGARRLNDDIQVPAAYDEGLRIEIYMCVYFPADCSTNGMRQD